MPGRYLVTGGAGYVGSHVVAALLDRGDSVAVIDSLRQGHRAAVLPGAVLHVADLADAGAIEAVLGGGFDAVLHLASLSLVGESMRMPFRYLIDNLTAGARLIEACARHGVSRFVLSSTANLFGAPDGEPLTEDAPIVPGSPYGESKWMLERALHWAERIHGIRSASLRYFNAAGADPQGRLGEDHRPETHLIPLAIDAALGRRAALEVFGDDYPTPDGTCIRDYLHVTDLAEAHLRVLDRLDRAGRPDHSSLVYNLGTGRGHSVRAVIDAVAAVAGRAVPHRFVARRSGDPPMLVAAADRIMRETGWSPHFGALEAIVRTAFDWRRDHPDGYGD